MGQRLSNYNTIRTRAKYAILAGILGLSLFAGGCAGLQNLPPKQSGESEMDYRRRVGLFDSSDESDYRNNSIDFGGALIDLLRGKTGLRKGWVPKGSE